MPDAKSQDTEAKSSALIKIAPAVVLFYCLMGGDLLHELGILSKRLSKLVGFTLIILTSYWLWPEPKPSYPKWVILGLLLLAGCFTAFDLAPVWLGSFLPTPLAVSLPLAVFSVAVYLFDRSLLKRISVVKWSGASLLFIVGYTILISLSRR